MKISVHTVHTRDQDNDQESHSLPTTSPWKFLSFLSYTKCCAEISSGFHVKTKKKKKRAHQKKSNFIILHYSIRKQDSKA